LKKLGVPVLKKVKKKHLVKIERWMEDDKPLDIRFPDIAEEAVDRLMAKFGSS
jgi:hypothetical protein